MMPGRVLSASLIVEAIKLNRSLALALTLIAPALIGVYTLFNAMRLDEPREWGMWLAGNAFIWASFMLPMSVTALSALTAQMEHSPNSWDHLRSLPIPRWTIYAAKAVLLIVLVGLMSMAVPAAIAGALVIAGWVNPQSSPTGSVDVVAIASLYGRVAIASLLVAALQFWTAIRYASFVPALVLGIGGTFFALVAHSAEHGIYFPWLMPVHALAIDPTRFGPALALGGGLGAFALVLAVAHLAARDPG
jgi:ABC-2 type transport system permease protein